jgi:thiamine-phosphate pyrophosphorylase
MTTAPRLRGLYVITDTALCEARNMALPDMVAQAIAGGAQLVQYRAKDLAPEVKRAQAEALAGLCRDHQVTFLVNDDVALAREIAADGVHLGQRDAALDEARVVLGPDAVIGISCHADLDLARRAVNQGADYVAFGRFFPSRTKPQAPPAGIEVLEQARRQLSVPIAAIGGVTPDNGAALIAAGADMLAVIHGVFGQADIRAAARRYAALFAGAASRASR